MALKRCDALLVYVWGRPTSAAASAIASAVSACVAAGKAAAEAETDAALHEALKRAEGGEFAAAYGSLRVRARQVAGLSDPFAAEEFRRE